MLESMAIDANKTADYEMWTPETFAEELIRKEYLS
jgi:hypothetical protein